ncbi:MAG: hypothetical protein GEV03_20695 [Streptosporangiales bacterium]|nr:hypothetical protein [Streptosporangiales bacterium]
MGIGASLFLIVVGGILRFATEIRTISGFWFDVPGVKLSEVRLDTVGTILMVVGGIGLLVTVIVHRQRPGRRLGP